MGAARQASGATPLGQAGPPCVAGTPHSSRQRAALERSLSSRKKNWRGRWKRSGVTNARAPKNRPFICGARQQQGDRRGTSSQAQEALLSALLVASPQARLKAARPLTFQVKCTKICMGAEGTLSKLPTNCASRWGM